MSRIAWSVVVMVAALAACSGKSDNTASNTGAGSTTPQSSNTATSSSGSTDTSGTVTNTTGQPSASAKTADTSASPAAAIGGPTTTPAAAANSGTSTTAQDSTATTTASNTGAMGAAAGASASAHGQQVFSQTCVACHGAGVAGAPKVGDKAEWGPRIAQGEQTLYQHAINGFQGKKGMMPPKGGNTALPDADVRAAVHYMVAQAK
jgi:cytochrome c5